MLFLKTTKAVVKKHWQKFCIYVVIPFSIIVTVLHFKFDADLKVLKNVRQARIEAIKKLIPVSRSRTKDTWKTSGMKDAAIFSAYLDARPEVVLEETFYSDRNDTWALIRIIAILEVGTQSSDIICHYKFSPLTKNDKEKIAERPAVSARLIASSENFEMRYSAAFVLCPLITADDGSALPREISFSLGREKIMDNLIQMNFVEISYGTLSDFSQSTDRFMAACIPSLHHEYGNYENLIEFVEFYRMMGVNRFTFYNTSVSREVNEVLDYYVAENVATVIPWKLPRHYKFERTLRYNGIFAALNDCLYRNTIVHGFTYIVNVDLDEFIVPRKHDNFKQMMNYLDPISEFNNEAAFIFRNVFFYLMYDDDPATLNRTDIPKLLLHSKTTRYEEIYSAYSRSKYIARGENVIEMGNHRVWYPRKTSFLFRAGVTIVDSEIGLSHHYRFCEVNELVCWLRETVVDSAAHKYTNELANRVASVYQKVFPNKR